MDRIIVVDVESTCWEGAAAPGEESEIIEIGICCLDVATGRRLEKESILVLPERSRVSAFCTKLTTLTQADADAGVSFPTACARIRDVHAGRERTWASYGDYDRRQFERQCRERGVSYPFGPSHINVKNLVALSRRLDAEVSMDRALELLGLPLEGTHHRGVDDAWNIAAILARILFER